MFDRYYESYEVGEKWSSHGRTVTETDIVNFAGVSGDFFVLHTDELYGQQSMFGQRIAHGALVFAMSTGLMNLGPHKVLAFYGIDHLRFTAPTFIGDTIHLEMEVTDKKENTDAGIVSVLTNAKKQTGEVVLTGVFKMLLRKEHEDI